MRRALRNHDHKANFDPAPPQTETGEWQCHHNVHSYVQCHYDIHSHVGGRTQLEKTFHTAFVLVFVGRWWEACLNVSFVWMGCSH